MADSGMRNGSDESLAVFGQVTANMCHELANVLGILNESTGLLGDLLDRCEAGQRVDCERLQAVQARVTRQTSRACDLIRQLSYFAHSVDSRSANVELGALARNITTVSRRLALLKGVTIELQAPNEEVWVACDPFGALQALFQLLQCCYETADGARCVKITVGRDPARVDVEIEGSSVVVAADRDRIARARSAFERTPGAGKLEIGSGGTISLVFAGDTRGSR